MGKKASTGGEQREKDACPTSRRKPRNGKVVILPQDIVDDNSGYLDEERIGILMVNEGFHLESVAERDEEDFYKDYYLEDDDTDLSNDNKNGSQTIPRSDESKAANTEKETLDQMNDEGQMALTDTANKASASDVSVAAKEERSKKNQRLTRRMARDIDEERAHIGLSALVVAVFELEQDMGALLPPKKRQKVQTATEFGTATLSSVSNSSEKKSTKKRGKHKSIRHSKVTNAKQTNPYKKTVTEKKRQKATNASSMSEASGVADRYLLAVVLKYKMDGSQPKPQKYDRDNNDVNQSFVKVTRIVVNGEALKIPAYKEKASVGDSSAFSDDPGTSTHTFSSSIAHKHQQNVMMLKDSLIGEQAVAFTNPEINQKKNTDEWKNYDDDEPILLPTRNHQTFDFLDLRCRHLPREDGGLKVGVLTWEALNPYINANFPAESSTQVLPRSRHEDIVYATWCSKLLNALAGPARCFACHEFFYSDIDRGW